MGIQAQNKMVTKLKKTHKHIKIIKQTRISCWNFKSPKLMCDPHQLKGLNPIHKIIGTFSHWNWFPINQ
jgi:hypothetical protein